MAGVVEGDAEELDIDVEVDAAGGSEGRGADLVAEDRRPGKALRGFMFPLKLETLPPGLITFCSTTKPLDKSWHVLGLGYNPSISMDEIRNAAVVHFNGNMKPWLYNGMNQFWPLWTRYVGNDNEVPSTAMSEHKAYCS